MNQLIPTEGIMESVIVKGDLSKLSSEERARYYAEVCRSIGLNALTKPFEYITLNGKLTLYALRNCTDQLRTIHGVSIEELTESEREGVFIVTAKVRNKDGRTDIAKGAVTIGNLKGEALANAMMKAETKAKRRATLSICGLGFLDETEVEDIPARSRQAIPHDVKTGEVIEPISEDQILALHGLIAETQSDINKFLKYLKVESLADITTDKYDAAVSALNLKKRKAS